MFLGYYLKRQFTAEDAEDAEEFKRLNALALIQKEFQGKALLLCFSSVSSASSAVQWFIPS
jgi:hypothetical protein